MYDNRKGARGNAFCVSPRVPIVSITTFDWLLFRGVTKSRTFYTDVFQGVIVILDYFAALLPMLCYPLIEDVGANPFYHGCIRLI